MERTSLYPNLNDDRKYDDQKNESLPLDLMPEDSSDDLKNEDVKVIIEAEIRDSELFYNVDESPPMGMTLSIGLQASSFPGTVFQFLYTIDIYEED
ncbi:hypothetical protein CHS0354_014684 [Potamilus streckersoni]|uniref:Uncharacterized protein n=1 Tax=Potamilus streckersoni TaxID=2493646 RepID=A0AAE0W0J4_9BIVA|nr:hypothetical protein CHS0354_014684 [Potamilus streckersoni]